ncbi:MAG: malto-oligosyltrehalose trehalohydrolase [Dehalococcoidia bacterium]|nr:malto-oligosyltrehalose trehalohydrolase [Dehalococcoidia bacterium]
MTDIEGWRPSLGAWPDGDAVRFRVWAPTVQSVMLRFEDKGAPEAHAMERDPEGYHTARIEGLRAGVRYRYLLDGRGPFPDPASRFQPEGVHGPSEVVDPAFDWTDEAWRGLDPQNTVLYELHVGTFTRKGTFAAAADALPAIAGLGVSAIQVMPVADFAGDRNWGYDGVALFAPSRAYGRPEDLRALVDRAHALGLGVVLDVVYNHFGPDGAYHSQFSPGYFTEGHHTPWGAAINLDAPGSEHVRGFFFESALHWLHEYHVDGFRLDAVHTLRDEGDPHFLAEFRDRTSAGRRAGQPAPFLLAEEHRNLAVVTRDREAGGYGFDAQYADDFHHEMQVVLTGDRDGYYQDFRGSTDDLATDLRQGWLFTGQRSEFWQGARGTDPEGMPLPRFMHCVHNHDQVGNRAFGDRLYHETSFHAFKAATAVLLFSAATPLLFMGDEWATSSQFLYFTDHTPDLGRLVTEGRRGEFAGWRAFSDPRLRERIPDPQASETFQRSRLDWAERDREPHASMLRFHQALLRLRREEPVLRWLEGARQHSAAPDEHSIAVRREREGDTLLVVARLRGAGVTGEGAERLLAPPEGMRWQPVLTTEDGPFVLDSLPVDLDLEGDLWCRFRRPGAAILRAAPRGRPGRGT